MNPAFLRPEQCCLYVIDPQERLMAHIHEAERVEKNILLLLNLARILKLAVFANTQYQKGIGPIMPAIREMLDGVPCPDKMSFNGFSDPAVRREVTGLPASVDTLLLCGVETHICVYQTAMGALQAGYKVWIAADAVSSRLPLHDRLGQERLRDLGAVLAPAEMIIYELLQRAGTAEFKAMLPHLK
jgi:nicotinamidase-related amidase